MRLTGETKIKGYPKDAPASNEDELVEAFVAGAISGRNMERDRLYGALTASGAMFFTLEELLELIHRPAEPAGAN
jgi:hypothetical protein